MLEPREVMCLGRKRYIEIAIRGGYTKMQIMLYDGGAEIRNAWKNVFVIRTKRI